MFQFESINDFIQMGGHGYYVWSAYLISLSVLIWLVVSPLQRKRKFMQKMIRQQRKEMAPQDTSNT
jgi:heme exporter protein D